MSRPPGRRSGLFSALFMITEEKLPIRVLFFRDHGIGFNLWPIRAPRGYGSYHAAGEGGMGAGGGAEPVRYL
jgi:hypothetical protein